MPFWSKKKNDDTHSPPVYPTLSQAPTQSTYQQRNTEAGFLARMDARQAVIDDFMSRRDDYDACRKDQLDDQSLTSWREVFAKAVAASEEQRSDAFATLQDHPQMGRMAGFFSWEFNEASKYLDSANYFLARRSNDPQVRVKVFDKDLQDNINSVTDAIRDMGDLEVDIASLDEDALSLRRVLCDFLPGYAESAQYSLEEFGAAATPQQIQSVSWLQHVSNVATEQSKEMERLRKSG